MSSEQTPNAGCLRGCALRGLLLAGLLAGPAIAVAFDDFGAPGYFREASPGIPGEATALALQLDGSALVGTSAGMLLRYQSDGALDEAFAVPASESGDRQVIGAAVLPDGKLVVALSGGDSYRLLRLQADGTLDEGFSGAGPVMQHALRIDALAILADGAMIVSGQERVPLDDGSESWDYIVVRHRSDGRIDDSFGDGGVFRLNLDNRQASAVLVAPQPDGGAAIASAVRNAGDLSSDFLVARVSADGVLDASFNGDLGALRLGAEDVDERSAAVLIQPDGALVIAGTRTDATSGASAAVLLRLGVDGAPDRGFGPSGVLRLTQSGGTSCSAAHALAQLPDQTLLVAGSIQPECGADADFLLSAVTSDGRIHAERTVDLGGDEAVRAMVVQPNGGVLLAGGRADTVRLVRFALGDPPPLWDLEPDTFHFGNVNGAKGAGVLVSEFRALEEFDPGIQVPLRVSGGEYALNGSSEYTNAPGWVRLGDEISVRHVANERPQESETTQLIVGGIQAPNNLALVLGPVAVLEFTSVTGTIPDDAGGKGALGPLMLALLGMLAQLLRVRHGRHGIGGRRSQWA